MTVCQYNASSIFFTIISQNCINITTALQLSYQSGKPGFPAYKILETIFRTGEKLF